MTRNGKIARLPKAIRDRLNQQIHDGVPGKNLVRWLNGLNEVVDVLVRHFNATRVTEQNLSEWKQGGYQDWLNHQETREWVRRISDEAEDVIEESGSLPWMERVGTQFELVLGKVVEDLSKKPSIKPDEMGSLVNLSRELARHRHLSQEAAKWRLQEIRRRERESPTDMNERMDNAYLKALKHGMKMINQGTLIHHTTAHMTPEQKEQFQQMVEEKALEYWTESDSPGFAEPSDEEENEGDPTESDSIQPDPTSFSAAV